jgi:subtilase family serine protease
MSGSTVVPSSRLRKAFSLCIFFVSTFFMLTSAYAYNRTQTQNIASTGQLFNFEFKGIPAAASSVRVTVTVYGDYGQSFEYADVKIDGAAQARLTGNMGSDCHTTATTNKTTRVYTVPATTVADGLLKVDVQNSTGVNRLTTNGCRQQVLVNVAYTDGPKPDLQVNLVSVSPKSVVQGGRITVRYQVTNASAIAARSFKIRLYFSLNSTISTIDTYLNVERTVTSLGPRASTPIYSSSITIPSYASAGSRFIGAYVDSGSEVAETNENNNGRSVPLTVIGRPDLTVSTFLSSSTTPNPGARVTVTFRLHNQGGATAGPSTLRVYLSTNDIISTSDTYLNVARVIPSIAAGARSTTYTATVTIPTTAKGGYYLGALADYDRKVSEGNESNNYKAVAINVLSATQADLQVDLLTVTPTTAAQGAALRVSYRIYNQGNVTASNFKLRLYYSNNDIISSSDIYLNHERSITSLAKGTRTSTYTATVYMPANATVGTGYIGAWVDYERKVTESNESNNTRAAKVTATATNKADLLVDYLVVSPTSFKPGDKVVIRYRIQNAGRVTASNFRLRLYYSTNDIISSSDTYTNHERTVASLTAGARTSTYQYTWTVPTTVAPTTAGYIGAIVDTTSAVSETLENNNTRSVKVTVQASAPDLAFTSSTVPTGNASLSPNSTFTGDYTIKNNGSAFTTNFFVRYYYCTSSATSSCTVTLGTQSITKDFTQGESYTFKSMALRLPSSAATGTRYIRAFVDATNLVRESSETNNNDMDPITVVTPQPDLQVDVLTSTPTTIAQGGRITVRYRIYNAGPVAANNFKLRLYYSSNTFISTGDTYLNHERSVATLGPNGRTTTYSVSVVVPLSATAGTGYIGAIVDYERKVTELNENNNTRSATITITAVPKPDLQVTLLTVTPTTQAQGGRVTVTYRITNAGAANAGAFKLRFYYSTNSVITTRSDTYLNVERTITAGLARGAVAAGTAAVTLPGSATVGAGYIGAIVDFDNKIVESNESNNTRAARMTVTASPLPDLSFSVSSVPSIGSTVTLGQSFTGRYTVRNNGGGNLTTDFVVRYYYCTGTTTATCVTTPIGTQTITTNLAANATTSFTTPTLRLPATATAGTRYIRAFVDATTIVRESSETNNNDFDSITVVPPRPDLQVDLLGVTSTTVTAGNKVTVTFRVANTGQANAGAFKVRLYLSTNTIITTGSDTYLNIERSFTSLNKGVKTPTQTVSVTIPANTTSGTYYVGAIVDFDSKVTESNESNNTRASSPIRVNAALPDLAFTQSIVPSVGSTVTLG